MMMSKRPSLAAIGCSGPVAENFIHGFVERGINMRLLARDADRVARRYPRATVVQGSMMVERDIAIAVEGTDAVFLVTPVGTRNKIDLEVAAARSSIAGARLGGAKHLFYTSVLGPENLKGPAILDAKHYVERLLAESGISTTVLRCGAYMQDVIDPNLDALNEGVFPFPVAKSERYSFTSQTDIPKFIAERLQSGVILRPEIFNFIAPGDLSIREVEQALSDASGHTVKAMDRFPAIYLLWLKQAWAWLRDDKASSSLPLIHYFDKHGCTDSGPTVADFHPDFKMTTLREHLATLWP